MLKYGKSNVNSSFAQMKKLNPNLIETKKENKKIKRYLYDFNMINTENIPTDIMSEIYAQSIKQTDIFNDLAVVQVQSDMTGKAYFATIGFQPYNIYSNGKNKAIYCIMEVKAVKINIHELNGYGLPMQESCGYIESGRWSEYSSYISDIFVD